MKRGVIRDGLPDGVRRGHGGFLGVCIETAPNGANATPRGELQMLNNCAFTARKLGNRLRADLQIEPRRRTAT
jgi:hypothetical protein